MPRYKLPPRLRIKEVDGVERWIIQDGQRQRGTGAAKAEVEKAAQALRRYLIEEESKEPKRQRHPDQVLIQRILGDYAEERGEDTKRTDLVALAALKLGEFFGGRVVGDLNPALCGEYVRWRTAQPDARYKDPATAPRVTEATAGRELVVLEAAIGWAYKHRRLDFRVPVASPPGDEPRTRHLTRNEAARLLRAARKLGYRHLCRFILLGLYTGTRHRALLELQWVRNTVGGHIDLEAGIIYRRPDGVVESSKRRTPCPIPARLLPHVRAWSRQGGQYVVTWGGWGRVIGTRDWSPAEADGSPITSSVINAWHAARELAGLKTLGPNGRPDVLPHTLRHTCATMLLQRGVSVQDVAGVLGTTEDVIRRTYGHHAKDHLQRVVRVFSQRERA